MSLRATVLLLSLLLVLPQGCDNHTESDRSYPSSGQPIGHGESIGVDPSASPQGDPSNSVEGTRDEITFPIETVEDAVRFAETFDKVQDFRRRCDEQGHEVSVYARLDPQVSGWVVDYFVPDMDDFGASVKFTPEGKLISTQEEQG